MNNTSNDKSFYRKISKRNIGEKDFNNKLDVNAEGENVSNSKRRRVLVMAAGGLALGETSGVRGELVQGTVDLVMDQNLGKHDRAIKQIKLALASNWNVNVVYVFKPFDLVAAKVID